MAYTNIFPEAFPYLYDEQWRLALQQKAARSRAYVNTVPVNGENKRFHKIAKRTPVAITARFGETNPSDTNIEFRSLFVGFKKDAARVDRREAMQLGSIGGPQSAIQMSQIAAANRDFDATLVDALLGNAYEGRSGQTPVALPGTQEIAVNYVASGTPANSGMSFAKLLRIKEMFGTADVSGQDVEGNSNIIFLCTHEEITDLLHEEKLTSTFYMDKKPLVNGEMYEAVGITIIPLSPELLPLNTGTDVRTCVAYSKEHVMFGIAENPVTKVSELVDGNYDIQLYAEWGWGATRLYDEGVIAVYCDRSPA